MLKAPIAAMFELSVCTGLITVIFISVISLTNPVYAGQKKINEMSMVKKIIILFLIVAVCGFFIYLFDEKNINWIPVMNDAQKTVTTKDSLWNLRHVDLIGQALILLTGIFAVVVLFKKGKEEK
jgi:NADH-quinone oxidoreductase subunit J